ncbi:Translation initiation factor IF-3 [Gracilariopsis chorda]|uniref:Translation initiation factor IF-3 n=1 Tax=Gracilariopsis chorda TaxID=448386 RepID=A0A2V3IPC7_9FLOR|nr:Translation initiation factor IF-3 [Gracilariopsis chorda]|eukprot:PXF43907.1 Translation initiation factor IF-3 [Gracilariopsis chorda]
MAVRVVALRRLPLALQSASSRAFATRPVPPRLNDALVDVPSVRLISESGSDCGLMSGRDALYRARTAGKDLMQLTVSKSDTDAPLPVVRIVDYEQYEQQRQKRQYQQDKAAKHAKRVQKKQSVLKQIRFSPVTDPHDMHIKMQHAQRFLLEGYRVKIYVQFRRGHGKLKRDAKQALIKAAHQLSAYGVVQGIPSGGTVDSLFEQPPDAEQHEQPRRPLHIFIQPLPKQQREKLTSEQTHHHE